MTLFETINSDIMGAMKSKDSLLLSVLRMVKGAMQLEKINKQRDLEDNEVIAIVAKQIKMRNEANVEFEVAGRMDLVDQNKKEIAVLERYMPVQLKNVEIEAIVEEAFLKVKPNSVKDMGAIMREVTPRLIGKADMKVVNQKIKDRLDNLN